MNKGNALIFLSVLLLSVGFRSSAIAQSAKKYHQYPYWINMMNDPNVNYVEACKAYDAFWNGRAKPRQEDDIIGQHEDVNTGSDKDHYKAEHRSKKEKQLDEDLQKYAFQCKKFENWRRQNAPFVKSDGHLMTADERLKVWQQQRGK
jgi:hypothetical protein